jgi:peptidoglycan/xylan/chitin deacetylase (PgdA/CDA1 family)
MPVLTFHKVDPAFEWGATRLSPARFSRILFYLKERGFTGAPLAKVLASASTASSNSLALTFDDGYESLWTFARPVMLKAGFTGTIFVITDYIGRLNTWDVNLGGKLFRHLDWNQIRDFIRHGFEIGSHTASHPDLTSLSDWRLKDELIRSKAVLEDKTDKPVRFLSFPFGRHNRRVVDSAITAGYERGLAFWRRLESDPEGFVAETRAVYSFDPIPAIPDKFRDGIPGRFEAFKQRAINTCSWGCVIVKPSA